MHRSRLTAVLIDVPAETFGPETAFWAAALDREPEIDPSDPDYADFGEATPGVGFMVQRVADAPRLHLDIETDDIDAEVRRLEALGATRVAQIETWWVMRDPAGLLFCVVRVQLPDAFGAHATDWPDGTAT